MKQWSEIRRKVFVEGVSKCAIYREYQISWLTLEKMLVHPEPHGYQRRGPQPQPKLGPFIGIVDEILEDDREALVK